MLQIPESAVWVILMIVFVVIEAMTVSLTSIWFALGALAGLIASLLDVPLEGQIIIAGVTTLIVLWILFYTRPWLKKQLNDRYEKTNYESLIGRVVKITQTVDNANSTGQTIINDQEWMVRSAKEGVVLKEGTYAKVVSISGVKLIVTQEETAVEEEEERE